jgi:galactose mutarotase-like enzyme
MTGNEVARGEGRWTALELRSAGGELEARFVPGAGMVGWSLRHAGDELLGHPVSLEAYAETAHPTGIPLLHPWANRLASPEYEIAGRHVKLDMSAPNVHTDPNGLPIHGLVAGWPHWEVVERQPSRLTARLAYDAWPELMAGFPFPHRLELAVELSDERMAIDTELVPTGDVPVPVAFGFHPYLRLPGLPRERWLLELPVRSRMELDDRMIPTGRSEPVVIPPAPLGDRTFDDAFDGLTDPPEFAISGAGRRLSLRLGRGYRFAQVYAPPNSDFICFEPMTAPVNPFAGDRTALAEPGTGYLARFEIAVAAWRSE